MTGSKMFDILLVEDDPGHAMLVQMNLQEAGISNTIHHVEDGQMALDYILGTDDIEAKPTPVLILLDLNLPVVSGFQVLETLKSNPETKQIPIIVLTTTQDEVEIKRCYELGCNVFVNKPVEYESFKNAIRQLGIFISIVTVPGAT